MTILYATGNPDDFTGLVLGDGVSYNSIGNTVKSTISLARPEPTGWAVGDTYSSTVANFSLSNNGDTFYGSGRTVYVAGGSGDDNIDGNTNVGFSSYMNGYGGNDTFFMSAGNDIVDGGTSKDVYGDSISFGYLIRNPQDTGVTVSLEIVRDSSGNPVSNPINTSWAAGDIYLDVENVEGTSGKDILYAPNDGQAHQLLGDFTLYAFQQDLGGDDILYGAGWQGGPTADSRNVTNFIPGPGHDILWGGSGQSQIDYETSPYGLTVDLLYPSNNTGDAEGDVYHHLTSAEGVMNTGLAGSTLSDLLYGDNGDNTIVGDPDNTEIYGNAGGADVLYGRGGNDTFMYYKASDSPITGGDYIGDFTPGSDKLNLHFPLQGGGIVNWASDGASTFVFVDVNSDGNYDMVISLAGVTNLATSDIIY